VYIIKSDGSYATELVTCDGSDLTIISETECTVPLSTLTSAPFNLMFGNDIIVKLIAINAYGESPESEIGSGATIQLVPDAPINLANILSITLDDRIGFDWDDGL
jgi:hypothetical protein